MSRVPRDKRDNFENNLVLDIDTQYIWTKVYMNILVTFFQKIFTQKDVYFLSNIPCTDMKELISVALTLWLVVADFAQYKMMQKG